MRYFYVYYSYEEWGRGYIGYRCSTVPPEEDNYFGSFKDRNYKPTQKIILGVFPSKEEAVQCEILLHNFFQVNVNPHFANRAKQTAVGFSGGMSGKTHTEETRQKMKVSAKSRPARPCSAESALKIGEANRGKKRTKEFRENLSVRLIENNPNDIPGVRERKSERRRGGRWIYKDQEIRYLFPGETLPEGWRFGRGSIGNGRKTNAD